MKYISIYNSRVKNNNENRRLLAEALKKNGFRTTRNGELTIVVGGDGTFLSVVRNRIDTNPIVVGFNTGNLGYFFEFEMNDIDRFIKILKSGDYQLISYPVFHVNIRTPEIEYENLFINEIAVERNSEKVIHTKVNVNDKKLGNFYGDGIIVSSSIGTNGYNSASRVLNFGSHGFLSMTPSNAIQNRTYNSLTKEPMFFPEEAEIEIIPGAHKFRGFRIVLDGKRVNLDAPVKLDKPFSIKIKKSTKTFRILRSNDFDPIFHSRHKMIL